MDARLSDICISTSAAPTYLPAHYFKTQDKDDNFHEFNLVDGGVAANNPVRIYALIYILSIFFYKRFQENTSFFKMFYWFP